MTWKIQYIYKNLQNSVNISDDCTINQLKTKNSHVVRVSVYFFEALIKIKLLLPQCYQLTPDHGNIIYHHASELCDINAPHQ